MKIYSLTSALTVGLLVTIFASAQTNAPVVSNPRVVVVSAPLRDTFDPGSHEDRKVHKHQRIPQHGDDNANQNQQDGALQEVPGPLIKATPAAYFDGVGASGSAPPDANMAVGPNHIFHTVNSQYAIYSKSGALILGPRTLSSLWAPLGSGDGCATNNGGDVIAQYDKLADRWVISQLGGLSAPYSECIAVSATADPTGSYYLYSYTYGTNLNDYPKFGVWPTASNSAYTATFNIFANGSTFSGGQLCAYDRARMLTGSVAQSICYNIPNDGGYLPSDLDGSTPPLDGTPAYFLNFETNSTLRMYTLAPNFATPSASVLTQVAPDLGVAAFNQGCGGGTCIPQPGTAQLLDSLGDRLMYRLAFRNFGDHEALVVNHSVAAGSAVGVRWYEMRAPVSPSATFALFQQGTFAPDATSRWMGSAAMDQVGNIGLGYSASSGSLYPSIRYTGRGPNDPAGVLGTEASIIEGLGSQTGGLSRWGDYSSMRIDPADDCTFWYTNEYLKASGSFNWSTSIGSFRFSSCGTAPAPDFALTASPSSQTVNQSASTSYTATVTPSGGFTGPVTFSASGLPAGAKATFTPSTVTTSGTSTMTVTASSTTPAGSYLLTITATSGMLVHSATVTLVVNAVTPNFALAVAPASRTVAQGSGTTYTVTLRPSGGFSSPVALSVAGLPSGASGTFSLTSITTSASSTLRITTATDTPAGTYTLTITGTGGGLTRTTTVSLVVTPPPDFSLSASPASRTVHPGGAATTYAVSIARVYGLTGGVSLTVSGLPAGVTGSFSPTLASGSSSTLTVAAGSTAAVGTYTLTIQGTSGSLVHTTTVTLIIQ